MTLDSRSLRTIQVNGQVMKVPSDAEYAANMTTSTDFNYGNEPAKVGEFRSVSVASLANPATELAAYAGDSVGALLVAYKTDAATNEFTIYSWDSADSGGADVPYVVAGSAGYWVACGGRYSKSAVTIKGNVGTAGVFEVDGVQVVSAQQAYISPAVAISAISTSAGTDTIDKAAFDTALGTLVTEINAVKDVLNALLLSDEAHGLRANS